MLAGKKTSGGWDCRNGVDDSKSNPPPTSTVRIVDEEEEEGASNTVSAETRDVVPIKSERDTMTSGGNAGGTNASARLGKIARRRRRRSKNQQAAAIIVV